MIKSKIFMFQLFLLFLITLSVADILKDVEEVDVVDVGSKGRLLDELDNELDARRNLRRGGGRGPPPSPGRPGSLPANALVRFPFSHLCVSQAETNREKRRAADSALNTAQRNLGQAAIQIFMQMIVQFSPVNTMCLGNLRFSDFTSQSSSNNNMKGLGCGFLDVPSRGQHLTNIGFSINHKRETPGFCSILTKYNNKLTFQMAFNEDLTGKIIETIPKVGKLLKAVSSAQVAFGISEGGYIQKTFTYWKGYNRSKTLAAHAMLKMNIVLDAVKLIERFFKKFKTRNRGKLPRNFISLTGDIEAYIRFNGNIGSAINCVFGGRSCSADQVASYIFDKEIYMAGQGKVKIDLSKIVGVLPKIEIDLNESQVYRTITGFYFKWKMPNVLSILGDLINHTIGRIPGMPRIRAERVSFDAYFDEDGFGFKGRYLGFTLECTVDFNKKDPVHCKFKNKFFAVMMEVIADIGKAAKAIYLETKNMVEDTGEIIDKGSQAAVEVGAKIINGAARGVVEVADHLSGELQAFVGGTRDWCDCNKRGRLRVWSHGTPVYELHARNNYQMIMWGKRVREVFWRCTDGGGSHRSYFGDGGSTWMVKFKHERKTCRKSGDWWVGGHSSGRIYWK